MLRLPDAWTWDFWLADTGAEYHVFFLRATRALLEPERRHFRAGVGHAVSTDLQHWTLCPDALVARDQPAWDDMAIWTGSVIQGPDGAWRMFYTGIAHAENGRIQRIGVATSDDLEIWRPHRDPLLVADARWYEKHADRTHEFEAWRDPWVFADPSGDGWHMLITARAKGSGRGRGVLGYATSPDLERWTVHPPRSAPDTGFGHLEVPQTATVDGHTVLLFSCLSDEIVRGAVRDEWSCGGVWVVGCEALTGPFDISRAQLLTDDRYYAGKLIRDRHGQWRLLAFHHREPDGSFDGRLSDPQPVTLGEDGLPTVSPSPHRP